MEDNETTEDNKELSMLEQHKLEREKSEDILKQLKEENDRKETLMAQAALGGSSEAGGRDRSLKLTDEEIEVKGAKEFFKGTALGEDIERANNG